jgi:2-keto-4-pentenoate hydratase/2-oxohepta-3-ene-1,7-dioic acid hydratase in catechol pathway
VKLATFTERGRTRIGVIRDGVVVDLAAAVPGLPTEMIGLLAGGAQAIERARAAAAAAAEALPLERVRLEAPVTAPRKFLGIGLNYESHLAEVARIGMVRPQHQIWFNKQVTCVIGPYDPIHAPRVSPTLDYEGELAIVIGTRCRHVPAERAAEVVAGYTICNDVSVREWQMRAPTATLGKSFDTHGPLGPWLVTPDELGDPHRLRVRTLVNGELRQDGNTSEMIFNCWQMIAELSTVFTLEPGDVLATGTPAGVGGLMHPPGFLKPGDRVRIEIENIGAIENPVIAEPEQR